MIAYTIEAALKAQRLDRVIVSTDDAEIAEVARASGADVPFHRPAQYAGDTASSMSVVLHALAWLGEHERSRPDAVALLAPTAPLRKAQQIDACVELLWSSGADTAVTVTAVADHPYFTYTLGAGGRLQELLPLPHKPQRRQDLPPVYAHSQAVVVMRRSYLERADDSTPVVSPASGAGFVVDDASAWDIDTMLDWTMAEHLLRVDHAVIHAR